MRIKYKIGDYVKCAKSFKKEVWYTKIALKIIDIEEETGCYIVKHKFSRSGGHRYIESSNRIIFSYVYQDDDCFTKNRKIKLKKILKI